MTNRSLSVDRPLADTNLNFLTFRSSAARAVAAAGSDERDGGAQWIRVQQRAAFPNKKGALMQPETIPFSWEAITETKPWQALTPSQRAWCLAWITNGHDALAATALAYSPKSARTMQYEVKQHPTVVAFLELYRVLTQGAPSREEQIAGVLATIREAPAYAQDGARRLLAQLTGVIQDTKTEASPAASPAVDGEPPKRVPAGATALADKDGLVRGYRTADGQYVQLAGENFEVSR